MNGELSTRSFSLTLLKNWRPTRLNMVLAGPHDHRPTSKLTDGVPECCWLARYCRSDFFVSVLLYVYWNHQAILGTGSPGGRPPRLTHSSIWGPCRSQVTGSAPTPPSLRPPRIQTTHPRFTTTTILSLLSCGGGFSDILIRSSI